VKKSRGRYLADARVLNNTKYLTSRNSKKLEIRFVKGGLKS